MTKLKSVDDLKSLSESLAAARKKQKSKIVVCGGTGCKASSCGNVIAAIKKELAAAGLAGTNELVITGCHGFCEQGPIVIIEPGNVFYCQVKSENAADIVRKTVASGEIVEELLYTDPVTGKKVRAEQDIPFYKMQSRVLLAANRQISPESIEDYIAIGGYSALVKALTKMKPEKIIEEMTLSGLRGRGGGGFPTGRKWASCRAAEGDEKYVVCNADEGDPGAYMDRSVLEGNPHSVLEGMIIGAYAVGASRGHVYVRNEYPLALEHIKKAVADARKAGILGKNILGTGFSFDVEIARGGGAFVCGESTALMASLEGRVGEPRPKDVHTVEEGLWDKPTNLNNVETWANVPLIVKNGAKWFASKGASKSTGTKIFALTGQVRNTGLVEVEMGTPLSVIVQKIGGGAVDGRKIKAVQTGGPSGGCLPAKMFNLPVEFDTLADAGSMVGSGGMVVLDDRTCMVDMAKFFLEFLQDESCGKCVPCRVGVGRMLEIVRDFTEGRGRPEQLMTLMDLGETIAETSLCGLGKTAPNPVFSTIKYFLDEYKDHIFNKKCAAGVCRELIRYGIDQGKCTGCTACVKACPSKAIAGKKKEAHYIDAAVCVKCGICESACKFGAISVQ